MVQVPTTGVRRTVQVRPVNTPFSSVVGTPADFGALEGRATARAGERTLQNADRMAQLALDVQRDENQQAAKEADNAFAEAIRQVTFGENGYYATNGRDTGPAFEISEQAINAARQQIVEGLPNQRVADMFKIAADVRQNSELEKMGRYAVQQNQVANNEVSDARIISAQQDAAAAWNDDGVIGRSEDIIEAEIDAKSRTNGWSAERTAIEEQSAKAQMYSTMITAAYQQNVLEGQRLFNRYKKELDPASRNSLNEMMQTGILQRESQEAADAIILEHPSIKAQRQAARAIKRPRLRDAVLDRINARYQEERQVAAEERAERSFAVQEEERADVTFNEENADAIYTTSQGKAEALAVVRQRWLDGQYTSRQRKGIEDRLEEMFKQDRDIAIETATLDAYDRAFEIAKGAANEQEALEEAGRIEDDIIRIATQDEIRKLYSDRERQRVQDLPAQAQEAADAIQAMEGLDEPAELAYAREKYDGQLEVQIVRELNQRNSEQELQQRRQRNAAAADAFSAIWGGQKLDEWGQQNPGDLQTIAADGSIISSLQQAEILVSQGKLFADSTDGKTLDMLRKMSPKDLSEVNLERYRANLTKQEFDRASALVAGAISTMREGRTNQAIYSTAEGVLSDFAPTNLQWNARDQSASNKSNQQRIINEMNGFVQGFFESNGHFPSRDEMAKEAQRFFMVIEGDTKPWRIGGTFTYFGGSEEANMSTAQRAVAKIDYDSIPGAMKRQLESTLEAAGLYPFESRVENLAGAVYFNDTARMRRILGGAETEE